MNGTKSPIRSRRLLPMQFCTRRVGMIPRTSAFEFQFYDCAVMKVRLRKKTVCFCAQSFAKLRQLLLILVVSDLPLRSVFIQSFRLLCTLPKFLSEVLHGS